VIAVRQWPRDFGTIAYGSYTSQVAVAANGSVKVKRIVCSIDCGMYVNPDAIEAQIKVARFSG
jgi:CO/xanthine dehydrogenase Mo-binding subunit